MATQVITDPIFLDSTANDMITALEGIRDAVQPINIYLDIEMSIPVNGWSQSVPYSYTWLNQRITTECGVEVAYKDGAESVDMAYLEYEKVPGGIRFTINKLPDKAIPLVVRVINAMANAVIEPVDASLITESAVPQTANVEEALENHESRITTNANAISDIEDDIDEMNGEIELRAKSFNGIPVDETGDLKVSEIEFARQIVTDDAQQSTGEFLFRTTGGDADLEDGPAKLVSIMGRSIHTGEVAESINMTVTNASREPEQEEITATIDRDTFVAYVDESGTTTLTFTTAWSENPALYGVTVEGTPIAGDQIVIVYVKLDRGLITNSNPNKFTSTGWNLYKHTSTYSGYSGFARVKKYSTQYGFLIGGTFTSLEFSESISGSKQTITPVSGYFAIPNDGYLWVKGGVEEGANGTYILMTWSDWDGGYEGDFEKYSETVVDLSSIMTNAQFPYGLLQVGNVADEINFSMKKAISRIECIENYDEEDLQEVIESGRSYDVDETNIYVVKAFEDIYNITPTGDYTASDHGMEIIDGGTVPVFVQTLYGQNLVDKLRRDVVTKSSDLVDNLTTDDSTKALTAAQGKVLADQMAKHSYSVTPATGISDSSIVTKIGNVIYVNVSSGTGGNIPANTEKTLGTIPSEIKPSVAIFAPGVFVDGNVLNAVTVDIYIDANGNLKVRTGASVPGNGGYIQGIIVYVI